MDELISRQALKQTMYHEAFEIDTEMQKWDGGCWIRYKLFEKIVDILPSVQPKQKTGRWILDTTQFLPEYFCTNCKSRFPLVASEGKFYSTLCCKNMNYCPNCGAKMESEEKHGTDD